jgi:hypothetical protein
LQEAAVSTGPEDRSNQPSTTGVQSGNVRCTGCGFFYDPSLDRCPLCGRIADAATQRTGWTPDENPYAAPAAAGPSGTFSLATLLLVVTGVAVVFGLMTVAPGLGILVLVLMVPALVRTQALTRRDDERAGRQSTIGEKVGAFVVSLALMALIAIAAGVAFLAACFFSCTALDSGGMGASSEFLIMVIPIGVAALVVVGLIYRSWPRRK